MKAINTWFQKSNYGTHQRGPNIRTIDYVVSRDLPKNIDVISLPIPSDHLAIEVTLRFDRKKLQKKNKKWSWDVEARNPRSPSL